MKVNESGDMFMIDWTYKEYHFAIYGKSPEETSDRDMAEKIALEIIRNLEGGWYESEKDYFRSAFFEGKNIPCISLKGQKAFHSGYELRDKDIHDISILEGLSE